MKKSGDLFLDDHRQVVGLCTETAGRPVGRLQPQWSLQIRPTIRPGTVTRRSGAGLRRVDALPVSVRIRKRGFLNERRPAKCLVSRRTSRWFSTSRNANVNSFTRLLKPWKWTEESLASASAMTMINAELGARSNPFAFQCALTARNCGCFRSGFNGGFRRNVHSIVRQTAAARFRCLL